MGLFRLRKSKEWGIRYSIKDANGKWVRYQEKIGTSHALAVTTLKDRLGAIAKGKFDPAKCKANAAPTFAEFMVKYWALEWSRKKGKGKEGMKAYLLKTFGKMKLSAITLVKVQEFYNVKMDETTAATANRYLARLSTIMTVARDWKSYVGENTCLKVKTEEEDEGRERFLSLDEIATLLGNTSPKIKGVVMCALHTGMRRGQILGLDWKRVNLARGFIVGPKAKRGTPPHIPITPQFREVLEAIGPMQEGVVFEVSKETIKRHFGRALTRSKILDFRFHDLRHTFASHFVMRTCDLVTLQKILGHQSPRMTQRYANLSRAHVESQMVAFSSGMPGMGAKAPVSDQGAKPARRVAA